MTISVATATQSQFTDGTDDTIAVSPASVPAAVRETEEAFTTALKTKLDNLESVTYVTTLSALAALNTSDHAVAFLMEEGKSGFFERVLASTQTSLIAADDNNGIIITSTYDTAFAWLRSDRKELDLRWFGGVANGEDTLTGWKEIKGDWSTSTAFAVGDLVWEASSGSRLGYRCAVAHTSGTFAADLAANKWVLGEFTGADNTSALAAMVKLHEATEIPMLVTGGKFRCLNPTTTTNGVYVTLNGTKFIMRGDGEFLVDDDGIANKNYNFFQVAGHPITTRNQLDIFSITGVTFRGTWSHKPSIARAHLFRISGYSRQVLSNCQLYDICGQVLRSSLCDSAFCYGNTCERVSKGSFRFLDTNDVVVDSNEIRYTGDDSIDVHDDAGNGIRQRVVIVNNRLKQCEGIVALGAVNTVVANNTIELPHGSSIYVGGRVISEGDNAAQSVSVHGNTIIDPISASADGTTIPSHSSFGGAVVVSSVAASSIGGGYDGSSKVIDPIVDDLYYNEDSDTNDVVQGSGFAVNGNVVRRTRPAVSTYSSWGQGLYFHENGFADPAVGDTAFHTNGIVVQSDMDNVAISGNTIGGFRSGSAFYLRFLSTGDNRNFAFRSLVIDGNAVRDCLRGLGTSIAFGGLASIHVQAVLSNNFFDLDPYQVSSARTSATAGTWNNASSDSVKPWGIMARFIYGFTAQGNVFANCFDPVYADTQLDNGLYLNNVVHCEPTSETYDANNKGVGIPRHGGEEFTHVIVDSTPTSATFGEILNVCVRSASSIPTTGTYVKGHRVASKTPTISSGKTTDGWTRLTTGSAHVINTDWASRVIPTS